MLALVTSDDTASADISAALYGVVMRWKSWPPSSPGENHSSQSSRRTITGIHWFDVRTRWFPCPGSPCGPTEGSAATTATRPRWIIAGGRCIRPQLLFLVGSAISFSASDDCKRSLRRNPAPASRRMHSTVSSRTALKVSPWSDARDLLVLRPISRHFYQPMRYIGSKTSTLPQLARLITQRVDRGTFLDCFGGMGTVGSHFKGLGYPRFSINTSSRS